MDEKFTLQYSVTNEGFPDQEFFVTLQQALVRLQELSNLKENPITVADIIYDNQDEDGKLYEVVFWSDTGCYEFESENLLPLSAPRY